MRIRNSLFRLSLLGCVTSTSLVFSGAAQAEGGSCPPGMYPIGGGGWTGCAPIPGRSPSSGGGSTGGSSTFPHQQPLDPEALAALREATKPLFVNEKGAWRMLSKGDGTGKLCNATFLSASGSTFVSLIGPSKQLSGMLMFHGPAIPSGNQSKEIRTVLSFNDTEPATVRAILLPTMKDSSAAIMVPTDMISTMRGTTEATSIALKIDGKEVFRTEIAGIMVARDAMLKCMKAS